jgi:hypothetical protein
VDDDELTLTRKDLIRMRPTPADIADAMRLYEIRKNEEQATESAQERLVMGAFGSWIKRRWKASTAVIAGCAALVTLGTKGLQILQAKAEENVLERQATEKQAKAVEQSTAAVDTVTRKADELGKRVEGVEVKVDTQSQITELLLELQLRDPKAKRLIHNDAALKAKIDKIPGVKFGNE